MNGEEFQKHVLERLDKIDDNISELKERVATIEANWAWIKRIGWLIVIIVAGKLGIDLSSIRPP